MMSSLPLENPVPLAERMRPVRVEHFYGQEKILAKGKILRELMHSGSIPSMILWGPPGTGKTSLATILSGAVGGHFIFFSAVLSGIQQVKKIVIEASEQQQKNGLKTILFVDEIHRFNKSQQDAFLPHVESGLLTLIGATTENPSFQVIAPLLSRCRVLVLEPLSESDLKKIVKNALEDSDQGLGNLGLTVADEGLAFLACIADGDARKALNILEVAATLAFNRKKSQGDTFEISLTIVEEASQKRTLRYDKNGEEHYNLISALHKSLRDSDPDGAIYWFYRMIDAGEDPLYISRRLIRFASEDIGVADPHALVQATSSRSAFQFLGSPEGELCIAQTVIYLATAPKSNAVYTASKEVHKVIEETGSLAVPMHIRNSPTHLMKKLGYGKNYKYAHDFKDGFVEQSHLPPEIEEKTFYQPTNRGYESLIKERLEKWKKLLKQKRHNSS